MSMEHDDVRKALLAGEITPAVTAHLDECPRCAALAADLEVIDEMAPSLETEVALPPDLVDKTLARIHATAGPGSGRSPLSERTISHDRAVADSRVPTAVRRDTRGVDAGHAPTGTEFFSLLTGPDRDALSALGHRRRYRRNTTLFSEGDHSTYVIVILSGRVRVSYMTTEGREIFFAIKGSGELLGELSAIDGRPRSATATTLGLAEVLMVEGGDFMEFVETHAQVALMLLRTVSERLREADRRQVEFGALDTVDRVVRQLVELARTTGEPHVPSGAILVRTSQQELAAWTGSSREAVNKALATLRATGWLSTQRGGVLVHDLAALERRAGAGGAAA